MLFTVLSFTFVSFLRSRWVCYFLIELQSRGIQEHTETSSTNYNNRVFQTVLEQICMQDHKRSYIRDWKYDALDLHSRKMMCVSFNHFRRGVAASGNDIAHREYNTCIYWCAIMNNIPNVVLNILQNSCKLLNLSILLSH